MRLFLWCALVSELAVLLGIGLLLYVQLKWCREGANLGTEGEAGRAGQ